MSAFETAFTSAGYGGLVIIPELQLSVEKSELVVILGSNGAGKSTTLRAIMGLVQTQKRRVSLEGEDLSNTKTSQLPKRGIVLAPGRRPLFCRVDGDREFGRHIHLLPKAPRSGIDALAHVRSF